MQTSLNSACAPGTTYPALMQAKGNVPTCLKFDIFRGVCIARVHLCWKRLSGDSGTLLVCMCSLACKFAALAPRVHPTSPMPAVLPAYRVRSVQHAVESGVTLFASHSISIIRAMGGNYDRQQASCYQQAFGSRW